MDECGFDEECIAEKEAIVGAVQSLDLKSMDEMDVNLIYDTSTVRPWVDRGITQLAKVGSLHMEDDCPHGSCVSNKQHQQVSGEASTFPVSLA